MNSKDYNKIVRRLKIAVDALQSLRKLLEEYNIHQYDIPRIDFIGIETQAYKMYEEDTRPFLPGDTVEIFSCKDKVTNKKVFVKWLITNEEPIKYENGYVFFAAKLVENDIWGSSPMKVKLNNIRRLK